MRNSEKVLETTNDMEDTEDMNAPEKIYYTIGMGGFPQLALRADGQWTTEYIRADIHQAALKERDTAIHERECCHEIYDQILSLCGYEQGQGYPGLVGAVRQVVEALAQSQERERALRIACDEARDCILNERHQMAEAGFDSDQVNAVLGIFDDYIGNAMTDDLPPDPRDAEIGRLTTLVQGAEAIANGGAKTIAERDAEITELRKQLDMLEVDFAPRSSLKEAYAEIERLRAALYKLRCIVFRHGDTLYNYDIDQEEMSRVGKDLIAASEVCPQCRGEGIDGDAPDANGNGGGIFPCEKCNGTGCISIVEHAQKLIEALETGPFALPVIYTRREARILGLPDKALAGSTAPGAEGKPKVVVLCGSTRFRKEYGVAFYAEEHAGNICLTVPCYKDDPCCKSEEEWAKLDELHKHKIDLADEILVIAPGNYIGSSTRSEIEYATAKGKPVRYWKPEPPVTAKQGEEDPRLKSIRAVRLVGHDDLPDEAPEKEARKYAKWLRPTYPPEAVEQHSKLISQPEKEAGEWRIFEQQPFTVTVKDGEWIQCREEGRGRWYAKAPGDTLYTGCIYRRWHPADLGNH